MASNSGSASGAVLHKARQWCWRALGSWKRSRRAYAGAWARLAILAMVARLQPTAASMSL
jgi:hypothetical protein